MIAPDPLPPVKLERSNPLRDLYRQFRSLWYAISEQGFRIMLAAVWELLVRYATGAPPVKYSRILPDLHVSGQFRRKGWPLLQKRGITAVVNMREEYDDKIAGIAPERYLHLSTVDNTPPPREILQQGVDFIRAELERGGRVYIHCAAGVGRAPTMAAAYLVSTGLSSDEAWEAIRRCRPFIRPTPMQIACIEQFTLFNVADVEKANQKDAHPA